jgi:hypothetical protein
VDEGAEMSEKKKLYVKEPKLGLKQYRLDSDEQYIAYLLEEILGELQSIGKLLTRKRND